MRKGGGGGCGREREGGREVAECWALLRLVRTNKLDGFFIALAAYLVVRTCAYEVKATGGQNELFTLHAKGCPLFSVVPFSLCPLLTIQFTP